MIAKTARVLSEVQLPDEALFTPSSTSLLSKTRKLCSLPAPRARTFIL